MAFVAEHYRNYNLRPGLVPVRRHYVALAPSPWENVLAHGLSKLLPSLRIAALLSMANTAHAATLTVGTGQMYDKPSQAFAAAKDGDTVRVYSETYTDDFAVIAPNGLHIEGVNDRPLIKQSSTSVIPNGKALWVFDGTQITIKNFEFSNAHCDNNCEGNPGRSGWHRNFEFILSSQRIRLVISRASKRKCGYRKFRILPKWWRSYPLSSNLHCRRIAYV